jgi:hypothetical protein
MQLVHWSDEETTGLILGLAETSILDALREIARLKDSGRASECHHMSHEVGRVAWKKYGNMTDAFNSGFDVCDFGFYHGVVEGAGVALGRETFMSQVPTMCDSFMDNFVFRVQCYHGAGHAAVNVSSGDLNLSYDVCMAFGGKDAALRGLHEACNTGVSMEWFGRWRFGAPVTPEVLVPERVCDLINQERFKDSCFEYLFNFIPLRNPNPGAKERDLSARLCDKIAGNYRAACYVSFMRYLSGSGAMNAQETMPMCSRLDVSADRLRCANASLLSWIVTAYPAWEVYEQACRDIIEDEPIPEAEQLCRSFDSMARTTLFGVTQDPGQSTVSVAIEKEGIAPFAPTDSGHRH